MLCLAVRTPPAPDSDTMQGMTYDEFTRQVGKAGISIREFARLVKMNHNSVTNCAQRGEVPSHLGVIAALMGEMAENRLDFRATLAKIDILPKQPRGKGKGIFGGRVKKSTKTKKKQDK
jgi:hypothetical protein